MENLIGIKKAMSCCKDTSCILCEDSFDCVLSPKVEDKPEGWQVTVENKEQDVESRAVYSDRKERMCLNRNILIPANMILNPAPMTIAFVKDHFELLIEIGNDHVGRLILSRSAMEALRRLEPETVIF